MANLITNQYSSTQVDGTTVQNDFTGRNGEKLVADAHAKYFNTTVRGIMFTGSSALTGVALPVGTSTAPTFGVWNTSSTKNLELIRYTANYVSGTITVGAFTYNFLNAGYAAGTGLPVTAYTAGTPRNTLLSSGLSSSAAFFPATATLTTAGTTFESAGFGHEIATAGPGMSQGVDMIDGRIIVPPGYMFYVVYSVAQTGVFYQTLTWAEVPV